MLFYLLSIKAEISIFMKQGVDCLYKITESYGILLSQEDIARKFYSIKEIDIWELEDVARKLGFDTLFVPFPNWKELLDIPLPAILFSFNDNLDFIIIEKVSKWSVTVYNVKTKERKKTSRFFFRVPKGVGLMLLYPTEMKSLKI